MLVVVVVVLALFVVHAASQPTPGAPQPGQSLPPPLSVPGQGTSGVPSPASRVNPLLATNAGQLIAQTTFKLPQYNPGTFGSKLPPVGTTTSVPLGPAAETKQLYTQMGKPLPGQMLTLSGLFKKL
jgi:hypothetical protein